MPFTPLQKRAIAARREEAKKGHITLYVITGPKFAKIGMMGFRPHTLRADVEKGAIQDTSQKARFTLLRQIALINWDSIKTGNFITLTYADECLNVEYPVMTKHRHRVMRDIESWQGIQVPMLWRKEYKPRQSGKYRGIRVPHWHIAMLGGETLNEEKLEGQWRMIQGAKRKVQVNVKKLESGEHAAFYMAKYLAKKEASEVLDYGTYLNNTGRTWGWHRKALVPLNKLRTNLIPTFAQYNELMQRIATATGRECNEETMGMTVLGVNARLVLEALTEMGLDDHE